MRKAPALAGLAVAMAVAACGEAVHRPAAGHPPLTTGPQAPSVRQAPQVARASSFGTDMSALFQGGESQATLDRALESAAQAGLGLVRAAPLWELTEPRAPRHGRHRYDWSYDDRIARALAGHGFRWVAVLAFAPGWASVRPHELHGAPRPGAVADYAAYAAAVARRYRGLIAAYEVWNEEDSAAFWRPSPSPAAYARLYLAARRAIGRVDPGKPVLLGGLADQGGLAFLARAWQAGGLRGKVDGVAVHPYGASPSRVLARVRAYRSVLRFLGAGGVPVYVTEYGWSTSPPGNPTYSPPRGRGRLVARVATALLGSACNVPMVIFYAWVTSERSRVALDQWYGLAAADGAPTPATAAVARAAARLARGGHTGSATC